MNVSADPELCQGHQMCLLEAPSVFGFDDEADHVVVLQPSPAEALRAEVQQAVRYCPAMALAVTDVAEQE
jgi:ferredoxin